MLARVVRPALDAIQKVAHVEICRIAGDFRAFVGQQGRVAGDQIAVVAGFDPAGVAFKADRAGTEGRSSHCRA